MDLGSLRQFHDGEALMPTCNDALSLDQPAGTPHAGMPLIAILTLELELQTDRWIRDFANETKPFRGKLPVLLLQDYLNLSVIFT